MNEIQERIEALQGKGWTAAAIADELGVTRDGLAKWKTGDRYPSNAKGVFAILDGLAQHEHPPPKRRRHEKKEVADNGTDTISGQPLEVIAGEPDRPLVIGDIEIPCYVLEDEARVISQRGVFLGLGARRGGIKTNRGGAEIPRIMASQTLAPFISSELMMALKSHILFKLPTGREAYGYPATLLVDICEAFLKARADGALGSRYMHIAERCEVLVRGLASVGIIALVDEATGYQDIRAKRSLAVILEKFIAKELQPWTQTFPYEFYEEIFRLKGWQGPEGGKRPSVIGHYTNDFVYERLAPGLLAELQTLNPIEVNGGRRHRHHQWFTPDVGHPKLKDHLTAVTAIMRGASTWGAFVRSINRAFPKLNEQIVMPLDED